MNTVYVHIDETLDSVAVHRLRDELLHIPHVCNVELREDIPHEMLIEYEEHHNMPVIILNKLHEYGLHSDIMSA